MTQLLSILSMSLPAKAVDFIKSQAEQISDLLGQLLAKDKELDVMREKLEKSEAELRRLKKLPKKPKLKPSKLDDEAQSDKDAEEKEKKGGKTGKRSKKGSLKIHSKEVVELVDVPSDWTFVGYSEYVIQDIRVEANNIAYQREIWRSPSGEEKMAQLPTHLQDKQFGMTLRAYILQQYYDCGASQAIIWRSLQDLGIQISTGQINAILNDDNGIFQAEKEELLRTAIDLKEELRTDDTGARHNFKNGYCNCINSDLFTYFETTHSKSRINFLEILRQQRTDYVLNQAALDHMIAEGLSVKYISVFETELSKAEKHFANKEALEIYLAQSGFKAVYAVRTITEGLLIGSLVEHGFSTDTMIHSDGAGQFNLFVHSLCWKHAERPLLKLYCYNPVQEQLLNDKLRAFWQLYKDLKAYKENPCPLKAQILGKQFDKLCESVENFSGINTILEALKRKKDQLLVVLQRPKTSLHNNSSERDIREYVKRRKISAGTRSEKGRKARDTFLSLKKTCRKLEVSFWEYLLDRLHRNEQIPSLGQLMRNARVVMD